MWFAIISSIIFLAITTFLFTPEFRIFPIYRSLSFFFLFEGTYALINFIITELWYDCTFMPTIHDIGCIIFGLYILITAYSYKKQNKNSIINKANNSQNTNQPSNDIQSKSNDTVPHDTFNKIEKATSSTNKNINKSEKSCIKDSHNSTDTIQTDTVSIANNKSIDKKNSSTAQRKRSPNNKPTKKKQSNSNTTNSNKSKNSNKDTDKTQ